MILNDLVRDRNYEVIVTPFNSQGAGPSSAPTTVYVGEAVPTGTCVMPTTATLRNIDYFYCDRRAARSGRSGNLSDRSAPQLAGAIGQPAERRSARLQNILRGNEPTNRNNNRQGGNGGRSGVSRRTHAALYGHVHGISHPDSGVQPGGRRTSLVASHCSHSARHSWSYRVAEVSYTYEILT